MFASKLADEYRLICISISAAARVGHSLFNFSSYLHHRFFMGAAVPCWTFSKYPAERKAVSRYGAL